MKRLQAKNVQLAEAYEQARVASNAKSDFLARMSHEIRTPMNAIIGLTTLAADHADDPREVREDLNKVAISSRVLLSIINDILDMSAIESGKLKIAHAPFDFKQLISSLTTVYYAQCKAKGIGFQTKLSGSVDEWLVGDQLRVNQILMNLLSNAVKFTDSGEVRLSVEQWGERRQGKTFLRFTVSDSGCGMDRGMIERLGRPFEQESADTARRHGGSGLGISIVKNLVGMTGGALDVKSVKGEGTTFTVSLPFDSCNKTKNCPIWILKSCASSRWMMKKTPSATSRPCWNASARATRASPPARRRWKRWRRRTPKTIPTTSASWIGRCRA